MINHDLARERNLDPETIQKIEEYQNFRTVLGEMYKAGKIGARVYREEWVSNEYKLQDLWGFERNPNFHKFWEMEGCTCPKLDNEDEYPYRNFVNTSCPIHGIYWVAKDENN